jgi:hypothetical protein
MENSRAFRVLIVATFLVLVSCAASSYHANKPNALGTDMEVSPDRVIAQCEFIDNYSGDYANPYGFMIYILDEEKTVITVSNGTVLEKEDCFKRLQAANGIIEKGRIVHIRGRGDAEYPREMQSYSYFFPKHGKFSQNGRNLNYLAIWNDRGQCYDAFYGAKKPCPRKR